LMPPRSKSFFPRERETERRSERAQAVEDLVTTRLAPRQAMSQDLPIDRIRPNPYQARQTFADLDELAEAIRQQGFISRLRVRPDPSAEGFYQLVYGERRLRAAELAGLSALPCDIAPHTDRELIEIGLMENIQRQDLNPLEEARAFQSLMHELDYSIRGLAERLGKHRSYIEGRLALLRAPTDVQDLVVRRPDTLDAARQIASVDDPAERQTLIAGVATGELTSKAVRTNISTRRSESAASTLGQSSEEQAPSPVAQRIVQDATVVVAMLDTWEQLLAEQPEQLAAVQDGLNTILLRAQALLDTMGQQVK
jgi:ParB family transcriptional regulator, chromosome partitioning protein